MSFSRPTRSDKRLLAFFGADVEKSDAAILQAMHKEGYTLVALDGPAVGRAGEAGVPWTVLEDWVDPAVLADTMREGPLPCESEWFEPAREDFVALGICWPDFDQYAMRWFWKDIVLAVDFARAFRTMGCQELALFRTSRRRPRVYYYGSDTCSDFLGAELDGEVRWIEPSRDVPRSDGFGEIMWARARERSMSRLSGIIRQSRQVWERWTCPPPTVLAGNVVLAMNPGELVRFTKIVEELREHFPGRVAVVTLSPENRLATRSLRETWRIPVLLGPGTEVAPEDLAGKFSRAFEKIQAASVHRDWRLALSRLDFHFHYYCERRWPGLCGALQQWMDLWGEGRPAAVLVSNLFDAESQLPAEAARRCGIPTFSVPHGGVTRAERIGSSEHILYSLGAQHEMLEKVWAGACRLVPCRGLVAENEYPVRPCGLSGSTASWRLLALTNPSTDPGCLGRYSSFRDQLMILDALAEPPKDLASRLVIRLKVHPGYPDLEAISAVGKGLERKVLPLDSNLLDALEETDLVVALNYIGSALIQILKRGKPLVYFWTNPIVNASCMPYLPAGVMARSAEEFWELVRRFFTDEAWATRLRGRAEDFYRRCLKDDHHPRIGEVIERVLRSEAAASTLGPAGQGRERE